MDHMELHDLGSTNKVHRHCFRHSARVANDWLKRFPNTKFGITAKLLGSPFVHEIDFATTFPLEHILIETDSPHCGSRTPTNVIRVAEEIARLRGIDVRIVVQQTTRNAEELYGIRLQH
ncbi:deoxyribonuclease TATDN2 [Aphelenchoides avenae]|nr:deoxyribonuclease TATDN2 [Aphelenchus avenae]